ncbi:MAG: hypothetical protein CVT97_02560 [Bacteroidetes bacterium HGW-Bacteroidetes-14]|jgi:endonuclease G|nr:MAG: hypothetical protein CVT97_02560 [Bacteroidetes bacterium HGW-Bacteroidetes-14]
MRLFHITKRLVPAILLLTVILSSCTKEEKVYELTAQLSNTTISASASSQFLNIQASDQWASSVTYTSGESGWLTLLPSSGTGNANAVLQYTENKSAADRVAQIKVTCGDKEVIITLTQQKAAVTPPPSNPALGWVEIPSGGTTADCEVVSHSITIDNKNVRNFSLMYDKKEKIAYWVAYPHHPSYLGSTGRTDNWQPDPKFASDIQPYYFSGISGFDRGHQIPSADRTVSFLANSQTFFFTNMTPQRGDLNQKLWANLEGQVRGWMSGCDTLYVVTGAILKTAGGNETISYATDDRGGKVAVPNYYYKVLLRLKGGNYDAIGFWYEHRSYGSGNATAAETKSIDQIEALTGFNFFANLPREKQDPAEAAWNPSAWNL